MAAIITSRFRLDTTDKLLDTTNQLPETVAEKYLK